MVWVIWINRNSIIFKVGVPNTSQMLHHIKGRDYLGVGLLTGRVAIYRLAMIVGVKIHPINLKGLSYGTMLFPINLKGPLFLDTKLCFIPAL